MALVAQGGSDDLHNCCTNRLMGRGNDNHNKGRNEVMNKGDPVQDLEKAKQYIDFEIQHLKGER